MAKILFIIFTLCFSFSLSAYDWQKHIPPYANQNDSNKPDLYYGPVFKNNATLQNMTVYGPLTLTNSTIKGFLTLHGPGILESTTVMGPIVLFGILNAKNSFLNDVQAATTELTLYNTNAHSIVIRKNGHSEKPQRVFLYGNSQISGAITFEQGNGKVIVSPDAKISGGVVGGTVQRQ